MKYPHPSILARSIASLIVLTTIAEAVEWNGSVSSDWNNPANWNGGVVPGTGPNQDARIDTNGANFPVISADIIAIPTDIRVAQFGGGTARLDHTSGFASTGSGNWMTVGATTGGVGVYNLANTSATGGTLTGFGLGSGSMRVFNSNLWVGGTGNEAGGTGTININTTGTLTIGNEFNVGSRGGTGTVRMDAGTINVGGTTFIGRANGTPPEAGTGTLAISGGRMTGRGELFFGIDGGTNGTLLLSGGQVSINGNIVVGANGGTGTATISGDDSVLFTANEMWIGNNNNSTGTMTVSGGVVSAGSWMAVGRDGANGTLTISGNAVVSQGGRNAPGDEAFELTNFSKPSTATVNLDGGTLLVNRILNNGGGTTNIYLNGGVLKARVNRGDFMAGLTSATVKAGGAIIDTNGVNITVNQPLVADAVSTGGGLTKNGAGVLALGGASTYTGATIVNSGKLQLNPSATIANTSGVTVNGGRGVVVNPLAGGSARLFGAVLLIQNDGNASSSVLSTVPVTLNGGTLEYHGGQGSGLDVGSLTIATGGAIVAQPQAGGGLMSINNLQLNASGTSTATFISTYGNIGSGDNTADVGHVNIATINGTPVANVLAAQNGILGGWATTFSTNNNADTVTHFATYGANGVQAVVYNGGNIDAAAATDNIRVTELQTVTANKTINSLESHDRDILINPGVTLTIETGGLIIGGSNHWIKEGTGGAGSITAGATSGDALFVTINDQGGDYRLHDVSVTNRGATAIDFVKGGLGLLSLDNTNTYTGVTKVNGGILKFNRTAALFNGNVADWTAEKITANSGGTVAFNVGGAGQFTTDNVTTLLTNLSTTNQNGLKDGSTIGFDTGGAGGGFIIADVLKDSTGSGGGAVGLLKMGGNTLTLTGANTYSGGTTVNGGTLQVSGSGTFGSATNRTTVNTGATLDLNGTSQSVGSLNGGGTILSNAEGAATLTVDNSLAGGNFSGVIANGAGTVSVTKAGDALQILSGASTYTGTTTIEAGILRAGVASVSGTSGAFGLNSQVVLSDTQGATLELANFNTEIGSLSGGVINGSRVLLGTASLTLGGGNSSSSSPFMGVISGEGALVKVGTGTQVLGVANNFSGGTTVNGGTLQLDFGSNVGTLAANAPIVINNGGTLSSGAVDGTGYYNNDTNNSLTINEGGTLRVLEGGRLSMDRVLNVVGGTIASTGTNFNSGGSYSFRGIGEAPDPANSYNFTSGPGGVPATISATHIGVNGATFNVTNGPGTVDLLVTGDIIDLFGENGLTKTGDGVMVLDNAEASNLNGPTVVQAGTLLVNGPIANSEFTVNSAILGGDGGILGATVITSAGTLAVGSLEPGSIGSLEFSGALTLEGTALFDINKTASLLTADLVDTAGLLTLGGNLTVASSGIALAAGDIFDLFNSDAGFAGSFDSVTLPALDAGLSWDTGSLATDGTLRVVPEPGTGIALLGGMGMLLGMRRRRSK